MRLLASADIQGFVSVCDWIVDRSRRLKADAIVLAGDLLGVPDGFESIEELMRASARSLRRVLDRAECPVLYIMGNDDLVDLDPDNGSCVSLSQ